MFKLFQEIRNSGRQRSRLIFLVRDREFLTDKVTKQAVVSPPFFQRLKLFCPHAISLLFARRSRVLRPLPLFGSGMPQRSLTRPSGQGPRPGGKGAAHLFQLYSRATLLEQIAKQKLSL